MSTAWLALRGPADARARDAGGAGLAADLAAFLAARVGARGPGASARLLDVGAGTGAGAVWLRPRLPMPQSWRLLDHDRALLDAALPVRDGWARAMRADLAETRRVLAAEPADALTCQALLDLLSATDIRALLAPALAAGAAVLAALTVTGRVRLTPGHPGDVFVADAFDAHQRRGGRLGPDAGAFTTAVLAAAGYTVREAATPWRLDASEPGLVEEWLRGRVAAAREQEPENAGVFERQLADRLVALRRGRLEVIVDHVDVLGLPPD